MSHKPVSSAQNIQRSLLGQRLEVSAGSVGLLYQGGNMLRRILPPGDQLSFSERRLYGLTFYQVDLRPHKIGLELTLPDKNNKQRFPIRLLLEYRVEQAERLIERGINDTEDVLQQELERVLRKVSRKYLLYQHDQFEKEAEDTVEDFDFGSLGLRLIKREVELDQTEELFQSELRRINDSLRSRTISRDFLMPDQSGKYHFPLRIRLDYKFTDPAQAQEQTLTEIETQIGRDLDMILRRECRQFDIDQYTMLERKLAAEISTNTFQLTGFQLQTYNAIVRLDDQRFQESLKRLHTLKQLATTPQHQQHQINLPSNHPYYTFEATVDVTYKLHDPTLLPTETLNDAEIRLWPKVAAALREISANYKPTEDQEAARVINHRYGNPASLAPFTEYGLVITGLSIEIKPNITAREREGEITKLDFETRVDEIKQKAAQATLERDLYYKERALPFYQNLVNSGQLGLMAMMLVNNPNDVDKIRELMDAKDEGQFDKNMEILKAVLETGGYALEGEMARILRDVANNLSRLSDFPAGLPPKPNVGALEAGKDDGSKQALPSAEPKALGEGGGASTQQNDNQSTAPASNDEGTNSDSANDLSERGDAK